MKLLKILDTKILFPLIIFFLGIVPLTFFLNGKLVVGGDEDGYMINTREQLLDFYVWKTSVYRGDGMGIWDPSSPVTIGYTVPILLLQKIGVPLSFAQGLFLTFWFVLASLGMYYLMSTIFRFQRKRFCYIAGLSSSLLYMFNTYNIIFNWTAPSPGFLCAYAAFPIMLAFFIRSLADEKPFSSAFLFATFSIFVPMSSGNLALLALIWFSILSFSFYSYIFEKGKRGKFLWYPLVFLLFHIIFNLWWIIPMIPFMGLGVEGLKPQAQDWIAAQSSQSTFLRLFQGVAHPAWFRIINNRPVFPFAQIILNNPIMILGSFLPLILTLIIFSIKRNKLVNRLSFLFFLMLYFFSVFFAKGVQNPFAFINKLFYQYFPGFLIFRSQVPKFGMLMIFCLSIVFGLSIEEISIYIKNKTSSKRWNFLLYFLIILAIFPGYPFFFGEVVHSGKGTTPSFYHVIPTYYEDAEKWLSEQKEIFTLYSVSTGLGGYVVYDWGNEEKYLGVDIDSHIFTVPVVHGRLPPANFGNEKEEAFKSLIKNKFEGADLFFSLFNAKYLLLHKNDITFSYYGGYSLAELAIKSLSKQSNLVLEKQFGDLLFYRIDKEVK